MTILGHHFRIGAALLLLSPIASDAQTLTAIWDPNPPAHQVTSYQVCIGTASRSCNVRQASVPASESSYKFTPSAGVLYYVAVRAVSSGGAGAYSSEIRVSTPSIAQLANQTSTVNKPISPLGLSANDPDGGTLRFSHTGLPFGLTLNTTTGVITGTPTNTGSFNVTVFVADGVVTTSRSFVWAVTSGSSDTTQPSLAITSHTSGKTVTTSSITLAGTATDNGTGNNGIASVTVNGVAATGGTASTTGTANWSRSVALSAGANTLTVVARDGAGNQRTSTISVTYAAPGKVMTGASLSQNLASPQRNGTTITFTASGSGGVGPYEYQWYVQRSGGVQSMVRSWSTTTRYAWTPTQAGTYTISIWARSAGATVNAAQATAQRTFVIDAANVSAVSVTPSSGFGASRTFALQYADSRGASALATEWVWFAGGTGICLAYHDRATNAVHLLNDQGTAWTARPLGSGTLQNRSCSINLAGSSVSTSGSTLTLNLAVSFTSAFNGSKTVRMFANAAGTLSSGWQDRGTWTVAASTTASSTSTVQPGVNAVSASPSAGSGRTRTFVLQYSDSRGASKLVSEWVWFSGGPGICMVYHERSTNRLHLLNDSGRAWLSRSLGSGTLENNSCSIALGSSSASTSGGMLTLKLAMTFKSTFAGTKTIQMFANAAGTLSSGWQNRGTWVVP